MTLIDTLVTSLGSAGYTFVKGSPYEGKSADLYKNHILFEYEPGAVNGTVRWNLTINYFHDNVGDCETLTDAIPALITAAVIGAPLCMYKGRVPISPYQHFSSIHLLIWEK